MIQLYLDLDLEPSQNHQAKLMADNFCDHEGWSNWDAAYEFSWEIIEGGLQNCQPITKLSAFYSFMGRGVAPATNS